MSFTDEQIRTIIRDTVSKLMAQENGAASAGCLFDDVNDAIAAAKAAQAKLVMMSLEERGRLVESMRAAAVKNAEYLAKLAHEETQMCIRDRNDYLKFQYGSLFRGFSCYVSFWLEMF